MCGFYDFIFVQISRRFYALFFIYCLIGYRFFHFIYWSLELSEFAADTILYNFIRTTKN